MNKIKKLALKYPELTRFIVVFIVAVIVAGTARLLIDFVEHAFNLEINPLVRIFSIALPVVIAISIVNVKLAKETREGEKTA